MKTTWRIREEHRYSHLITDFILTGCKCLIWQMILQKLFLQNTIIYWLFNVFNFKEWVKKYSNFDFKKWQISSDLCEYLHMLINWMPIILLWETSFFLWIVSILLTAYITMSGSTHLIDFFEISDISVTSKQNWLALCK